MILTRKQYDKIIDNEEAVAIYLTSERNWFLGGVRISGLNKDQETIIFNAAKEKN